MVKIHVILDMVDVSLPLLVCYWYNSLISLNSLIGNAISENTRLCLVGEQESYSWNILMTIV